MTDPQTLNARIIQAGRDAGFVADGYLAAAREALTMAQEQIEAGLTPALNTGTAMDALILVAGVLRDGIAALTEPEPIPEIPRAEMCPHCGRCIQWILGPCVCRSPTPLPDGTGTP
jgi:hypothetical protein